MTMFSRRSGTPAAVRSAVLDDLSKANGDAQVIQAARRCVEECLEKAPGGADVKVEVSGGFGGPSIEQQLTITLSSYQRLA